ncbi:hypothetical protein KP509_08G009200 [Ceratopteris richardii]|nr:hypothetical protein KP509_08G009200 [Ceratopteris richardii]
MQLNNSRIRVLQAQDDLVQSIKEAAKKKIYALSTNHRVYRHLIRDLVVQGLIMLKEPYVVLQCRHVDVELVKTVLQLAKDKYAAKMKAHPPDVVIDDKFFLAADGDCAGGVILTSKDGRIICDNTLDSRLEVTFRQILPEIWRRLLGNGMSVNRADT